MHQTHFLELLNPLDVNGAPSAGRPARSEANHVAGFVDVLSKAVDPAKTEGGVYGYWLLDTGLYCVSVIEADKELAEFVVMDLEPATIAARFLHSGRVSGRP